jgi:hypothetical protein
MGYGSFMGEGGFNGVPTAYGRTSGGDSGSGGTSTRSCGAHDVLTWRVSMTEENWRAVAVVDRPCQTHDHGIAQRRCTFQLRRLGCQWDRGGGGCVVANQRNCVLTRVYAKAHMTNRPSLVILPEAMELSRTTFACPSWRLSGVAGTKVSAYGARWVRIVQCGETVTCTMLVPLHKAG